VQWDRTIAFTPEELDLQRGYTRLSTEGFQQHLLQCAAQAGVTMHRGTVSAVEHHDSHSTAVLDSGETLSARIIVDASGHAGGFVKRSGNLKRSWQHAYGVKLRVPGGHPWPLGQMVLMDFRLPQTPDAGPAWHQTPTFLYAMPLDKEHVFVEETSLVHFQPPSVDALRERLWLRLSALGVSGTVLEEERCRIQMTGPPAEPGQRLLAYGTITCFEHTQILTQLV
jgi:lycopene cyclase-like protein